MSLLERVQASKPKPKPVPRTWIERAQAKTLKAKEVQR